MGIQRERDKIGIYVHIPYCVSKCPYCDFKSVVDSGLDESKYIDSLLRELDRVLGKEGALRSREIESIYLGGGTPSLFSSASAGRIIREVKDAFDLDVSPEITVEVNPDTVNREKFEGYKEAGVNRISIGFQSLNDGVLKTLGRTHSAKRAVDAFMDAREACFDNIGVDLIFAVPGQTVADWEESLMQAVRLSPEHISLYGLTLEEGTPFCKKYKDSSVLPSEDDYALMYGKATEVLKESGYVHYEISNWARPGKQSIHNQRYWLGGDYIGLGVSAHSFLSYPGWGRRWWNEVAISAYMDGVQAGGAAVAGAEALTREEALTEAMFLGLRMLKRGLRGDGFKKRFGISIKEAFKGWRLLKEEGLLKIDGEDMHLTGKGVLVSDEVFARMAAEYA
ncbi:MAG: radical SAM family heme chaperone HemW [Deltaproteobacteria bacterium]|nr:radical SAM family heme chaperone HemW [Deltaproteobacteria bacterium]